MPNPYAAEFCTDAVRVTRIRATTLTADGQNAAFWLPVRRDRLRLEAFERYVRNIAR